MPRWRRLGLFAERENVCRYAIAESPQVGLDLGVHRRRQSPTKVGAQQRIVFVLIAEPRRFLKELEHTILYTDGRPDSPGGVSLIDTPRKSEGGVRCE